jgi:hypothetical protein
LAKRLQTCQPLQALIDGNNLDRKYVHSFLQVLADHSQFSDKVANITTT